MYLRQKNATRAKLAARRHIRAQLMALARDNAQRLGRSNAAVLRQVARELIDAGDAGAGDAGERNNMGASSPARSTRQQGERIAALLCFDEMQVTDVFAAVALKGILEALSAEGCIIVATSNRAPWELSRHGLHEDLFNHLVDTLVSRCLPYNLSALQDYRRLLAGPDAIVALQDSASASANTSTQELTRSYFYPLGAAADAALQHAWQQATAVCAGRPTRAQAVQLEVMFGRRLSVPRAAGGVAWFGFGELCDRPRGAADYIALAQAFHTVFLAGVPQFSLQSRDKARRFITLVDELYNHRARLVASAAVAPEELFAGSPGQDAPIIDLESLQFESAVPGSRLRKDLMAEGGVAPVADSEQAAAAAAVQLGGLEEQFAFKRAVSRLYEMQTPAYLHSRAAQQPAQLVEMVGVEVDCSSTRTALSTQT